MSLLNSMLAQSNASDAILSGSRTRPTPAPDQTTAIIRITSADCRNTQGGGTQYAFAVEIDDPNLGAHNGFFFYENYTVTTVKEGKLQWNDVGIAYFNSLLIACGMVQRVENKLVASELWKWIMEHPQILAITDENLRTKTQLGYLIGKRVYAKLGADETTKDNKKYPSNKVWNYLGPAPDAVATP